MHWYITDLNIDNSDLLTIFETNISNVDINKSEPLFYIDGFVIPRMQIFEAYCKYNQNQLLRKLFEEHGLEFIKYVKGVFTIILFIGNKFYIFNDHQSIKKYFIYQKNNSFFITNSLELLSKKTKLSVDFENAAIFTMFSHFFDGQTLFQDVLSCRPAQLVSFIEGRLLINYYWKPLEILKTEKRKGTPIKQYSKFWSKLIKSYIDYLNPKGISLTLTGGNDSRMVLSALYSEKIEFKSFIFGNPSSLDGIVSKEIAKELKLDHSFYFVENPTSEWFGNEAIEILQFGNSLVNIHRAHRNNAVKQELKRFPKSEMIITGLVGGELFKEPQFDNITIPTFFEADSYINNKKSAHNYIKTRLSLKGVKIDNVDISKVYEKLISFANYTNGLREKEAKFIYTFLFYACAHHTQDANVFGKHFNFVINPFMDIDFLYEMASYKNWFVNKKSYPWTKLFHSQFYAAITDILLPQLSNIPYAKNGSYTANDLLRNKVLYLIKRSKTILGSCRVKNYPQSFPMGTWTRVYSEAQLENMPEVLERIFDVEKLKNMLEIIKDKKTEASWHCVTNPINLKLNYLHFCDA